MYLSPENLRNIYPKVIYTICENSLFVDLKNATLNQNKIEGVKLYDTPTVFLRGARTAGTVTEDVNGFIADQSDEAFAEKIEQILNDKEYYNKVAEGAKSDLYVTWDEVVSDIYKDYGRLIAKKKAGVI